MRSGECSGEGHTRAEWQSARRQLVTAALLTVGFGARPLWAAPAATGQDPVQEAPEEQAADPQSIQEEAPPQPIAEGEVQARSEVVTAAIRRMEALIQPDPGIAKIAERLEAHELSIEVSHAELDALAAQHASPRRLGDMRLPWLELSRDLSSWKARAEARFTALQEEREYLRTVRAQWEQTRASAEDQEFTPDLSARVDTVLERVIDIETRVRERRNGVGAVVEHIASCQERISDALDRIEAITDRRRQEWLTRDAAPLWRSFGEQERSAPALDPAQAAREWTAGLVAYVQLLPGRLLFLVLSFLGWLWATLQLRRRRGEVASATAVPTGAQDLLGRPISVALAGALLFTLPILPYPTGSASDLVLALTIVPVVRLGSVLLGKSLRSTVYQVVALTVMVRVAGIGADALPHSRLLLLAVTGLALIVVASKVRLVKSRALRRRWGAGLLTLTLLATATLGVALGANGLGWLQLSRALTEGTIASLFSALAWLLVAVALPEALRQLVTGDRVGWQSGLERNRTSVTRVLGMAAGLLAACMWLRGTLIRFQLHGPAMQRIQRLAEAEIAIGGLTVVAGDVFAATVVLLTTWLTARLVQFLLREQIVPSLRLSRGSRESVLSVARYTIWGTGLALAASSAGLSGTQLAVVVGALGLGIGFGLQTIVNNFVSGLILIFERPIKVGDTLEMPNYWGRVERIGIRASVIRSFEGAEIIVPNGDLISKEVVNWTGTDELRRAEVQVGVAYGSDPDAVLEILRRVAGEHPLVLEHPEIRAQMIGFGESALEFRLRCWTQMDDWVDVVSDLHVATTRELAAAGITIPFPQRDLHIKPAPPTP